MKSASMRDIAAKLGISAMTVSNVLSGRKKVSPELAAQVLKTAQELGFKKDVFASLSAGKRSGVKPRLRVAFNAKAYVESSSDAIKLYRDIYFRLLARLRESGHELVLAGEKDSLPDPELALADAVIDFDKAPETASSSSTSKRICAFFENPGCWCVQPDNETAGKEAARLLSEAGCKKVATFASSASPDQQLRLGSFLRHCEERKLAATSIDICKRTIKDALRSVLSKPESERPDAFFMLCGATLMHAQRDFPELLKTPSLQILGFDNFGFYEWLPVEVARLYFEPDDIADALAAAVEGLAEGRTPVKSLVPIYFKPGATLRTNAEAAEASA